MADICREHGISEATYYIWKKKYSGSGLSELREENSKLEHLVADLSLDQHFLQEIAQKSCKASPSTWAGSVDADGVRAQHTAGGGADDDQSIDDEPPKSMRSAARATGEAARAGYKPSGFRLPTPDGDAQA